MVEAGDEPRRLNPVAGWRPYQFYLVGMLLLVTVFHYLDRGILSVLQEPLKEELKLTDGELGLLSGPALVLLYSAAGLTVARYAERHNRASLLAAALATWSLMTALCGASVGFVQLALARMGVGAGEGGCIPIAQSLLADSFPIRQRGFVMSIVAAAPAVAGIITPLVGGLVAHAWGWRVAFAVVGLPGLALALVIKFTIKEPRVLAAAPVKRSSALADVAWLMKQRAFLYIFLAAISSGIGVSGINAFKISYLVRSQHMNLAQAGVVWSIAGVFGLAGSVIGGYVADRFAGERGRAYVLVPVIGAVGSFMAYAVAFSQSDPTLVVVACIVAALFHNLRNGPEFAAIQNIAPSRMRATVAATYMFGATVLGGATGPLLTGALSGVLSRRAFGQVHGGFDLACPGGHAARGAALDLAHACASASADGLRAALLWVNIAIFLVAGLLYMSSRTIRINHD